MDRFHTGIPRWGAVCLGFFDGLRGEAALVRDDTLSSGWLLRRREEYNAYCDLRIRKLKRRLAGPLQKTADLLRVWNRFQAEAAVPLPDPADGTVTVRQMEAARQAHSRHEANRNEAMAALAQLTRLEVQIHNLLTQADEDLRASAHSLRSLFYAYAKGACRKRAVNEAQIEAIAVPRSAAEAIQPAGLLNALDQVVNQEVYHVAV